MCRQLVVAVCRQCRVMGVKEDIDEDTSNGVKSIWRCLEVHIKSLMGFQIYYLN